MSTVSPSPGVVVSSAGRLAPLAFGSAGIFSTSITD